MFVLCEISLRHFVEHLLCIGRENKLAPTSHPSPRKKTEEWGCRINIGKELVPVGFSNRDRKPTIGPGW